MWPNEVYFSSLPCGSQLLSIGVAVLGYYWTKNSRADMISYEAFSLPPPLHTRVFQKNSSQILTACVEITQNSIFDFFFLFRYRNVIHRKRKSILYGREFLSSVNKCHVISPPETIEVILSSRWNEQWKPVKKVTFKRECGSQRGYQQVLVLSNLRSPDTGREKKREAKWLAGTPKRKWGLLPLSGSK